MIGLALEPWLEDCIPQSGELALDVGANVGDVAACLLDRFSEVHCFEPNPDALWPLIKRVASRARIIESALGAGCGTVELHLYADSAHASVFGDEDLDTLPRGQAARTVTVPLTSLDELGYARRRVDFVKVDTEGSECAVLAGAHATLLSSLPAVLVEIHSEPNGSWCAAFLVGLGYTITRITHPHAGVPPGHHWLAGQMGA